MAQRTVLVDDLDGGDAAETLVFALDGTSYEIDLNEENAGKLRDDLATWISHGRPQSGGVRRGRVAGRRPGARGSGLDNAAIRSWARETGYNVSDRGRIPAEIVEAYNSAS